MRTRESNPLGANEGAKAGTDEGSACGKVTGSSESGKPIPIVTAAVPCPPSTTSTGAGRPPNAPLAIGAQTAPCEVTPDENPPPAGLQVSPSETANRPSAALPRKVSASAETGPETAQSSPINPESTSVVSGDQPPSPAQDGHPAANALSMSAGATSGNHDSVLASSSVEAHIYS